MPCRAIAAALATLALALPARAATFNMVTGPDYVPFTGQALEGDGLAVDVLRAALESQGHDLNLRFMPWKRAFELTARGAVDGTFPYIHTRERAREVRYSEPMFTVRPRIISSAAAPVRFDGTKTSLAGRRLCLPVGYAPESLIAEMLANGRLKVLETRELFQCPALIQNGRADFMVQSDLVWPALVARSHYERTAFHVAEEAITVNQLHVIVGKAHPETERVLEVVNQGLAAIRADRTFVSLVEQHTASQD